MPLYVPTTSSAAPAQLNVDYRMQAWQADAVASTLFNVGATTLAATGTAAAANVTTSTVAAPIVELTSGATAGAVVGWTSGQPIRTLGAGVDLNYRIVSLSANAPTASNGVIRYWVGLFGGTPSGSDNPTSVFGYGFVAPSNSLNWSAWAGNGSNSTVVTTNVAAFSGTTTRIISQLRIIPNSTLTAIDYYINGASVARITTTLPPAATGWSPNTFVQATTLTAVARGIAVSRIGYNLYW